jgi:ketosteroid isomerase-like protein
VRATEKGATVTAVIVAFVVVGVVCMRDAVAQQSGAAAKRTVEIRSYNLKPGTRDRFHQLVERDALPLLRRARIDVVAYGPSLHDADSYFLMRSFASVDDRQRTEDAFYGSAEWRQGPREAILACIDNYTTVVVELDEAPLDGFRSTRLQPRPATSTTLKGRATPEEDAMTQTAVKSDYAILLDLNADYIRAVQTSDVARFREILADDFLCSLPDGSLIDKARFLEQTAVPASISNLEAHDVQVRLMGDFAIVHARTTFTLADGRPWSGRYTDVWARRQGRWVAIAAHVTRR